MKLASTGNYVIRLGGAVDFGSNDSSQPPKNSTGDSSVDCLPKNGTLRFVMRDGAVKKMVTSRGFALRLILKRERLV